MSVGNGLDICRLFHALWAGEGWIVGGAVLSATIVLVYIPFACQEWSAMVVANRSTVNMLGGYYSQQQFLRNLGVKADLVSMNQSSTMNEAHKESIMQLASWDARRDFQLQTGYYKQRQLDNARTGTAMLGDLTSNIQFTPGNAAKSINNNVKSTAETGQDVSNLLRQYVAFASQRAAGHFNDELKGAWATRTVQTKA